MILETLASAGISKKAACEKVGVSYPTPILWDSEPVLEQCRFDR